MGAQRQQVGRVEPAPAVSRLVAGTHELSCT